MANQSSERIIICGVGYQLAVHEGLAVFSQDSGFYGVGARITFERKSTGQLYVQLDSNLPGGMMWKHVQRAAQIANERL